MYHFLIILCMLLVELCINACAGKLIWISVPLVAAFHVSFYTPLVLRITALSVLFMQAVFYQVFPVTYLLVLCGLGLSAPFMHALFKPEPWARLVVTGAIGTVLLVPFFVILWYT